MSRCCFNSKIRIGEDFFNEIIRRPVPLDMNILKAIKRSPLGLDLYLWVAYRTFALERPLRISWRQLYRQFGAEPSKASNHYTVKDFRRKVLRELVKIKAAWPDLNYTILGLPGAEALEVRCPYRTFASTRGIVLWRRVLVMGLFTL